MRTMLAATALLLAVAACSHDSSPDVPADQAKASTTASGAVDGFTECTALFKAGQPAPAAPAANSNGMSCSISADEIEAVGGIRCRDESFIWESHNPKYSGWGLAGGVWHAGDFHVEDPDYSAALSKCLR